MTAPMLESYVAGRWFAATDDGARVADAVTGDHYFTVDHASAPTEQEA